MATTIKFVYDDMDGKIRILHSRKKLDVAFLRSDLPVGNLPWTPLAHYEVSTAKLPAGVRFVRGKDGIPFGIEPDAQCVVYHRQGNHVEVCGKELKRIFTKIPKALWIRRYK